MAEKKNLVEDALLQMKNLEEAVAQNAKGILAATMGQEINELVKESLSEADEEEEAEIDVDITNMNDQPSEPTMGDDDMGMSDDYDSMSMDDDDDMMMSADSEIDMDDDEVIDLRDASDDEIMKVFKSMGEDDGIIISKDDNMVHLEDTNEDTEYMIDLGESEGSKEEEDEFWGPYESEMDETMVYSEDEDEELVHETDMDEDYDEEDEGVVYELEMDEDSESDDEEEVVYEIEMDETSHQEDEGDSEDYDFKKTTKSETKEGKMTTKPKGVGMGSPKFSYKKVDGGFKEDMKHGNPKMGTGKPKFEYKESKKSETKEASRTYGSGKYFGKKGLPKPKAAPRHLKVESVDNSQIEILREKNEEYRKALNIFRQKLNEVAVFNSNLAYATRLFTEHSTSKQEKINILRRFDGVESIKESKALYKTLKDELSGTKGNVVTESIEKVIEKNPQSGSASNLIESKTYENPQFLRMKDLMSKLIK